MISKSITFCLAVFLSGFALDSIYSQGGGFGGGGFGSNAYDASVGLGYNQKGPASSNHLTGNGSIQVSGTAKISVQPEALRLVVALTSKAATANECAADISARIDQIRESMADLKIADKDIVEDFIVVKRSYKWEPKQQNNTKYFAELEDGFRMQTNLHVLCKDEKIALSVINKCFSAGVKEVVSFDYWHADLDQFKKNALSAALDAAKEKGDLLLSVFDERPRVMNVSNNVIVSHPASQYKTLKPYRPDPSTRNRNWGKIAEVFAERPDITYYEGNNSFSDISPENPPMHPTISVSATVTLTYESPRQRDDLELRRAEIAAKDKNEDD